MGETCGTKGGQKRYTGFWSEDMAKRDHLEDLDVDGRMILKWIFNKWDGETKIGLR